MAFAVQQGFFAVNQPLHPAVFRSILPVDQLAAGSSLNMMVMQAEVPLSAHWLPVLIPFISFPGCTSSMWRVLSPPWARWYRCPLCLPPRQTEAPGLRSIATGLRYLGTKPFTDGYGPGCRGHGLRYAAGTLPGDGEVNFGGSR